MMIRTEWFDYEDGRIASMGCPRRLPRNEGPRLRLHPVLGGIRPGRVEPQPALARLLRPVPVGWILVPKDDRADGLMDPEDLPVDDRNGQLANLFLIEFVRFTSEGDESGLAVVEFARDMEKVDLQATKARLFRSDSVFCVLSARRTPEDEAEHGPRLGRGRSSRTKAVPKKPGEPGEKLGRCPGLRARRRQRLLPAGRRQGRLDRRDDDHAPATCRRKGRKPPPRRSKPRTNQQTLYRVTPKRERIRQRHIGKAIMGAETASLLREEKADSFKESHRFHLS